MEETGINREIKVALSKGFCSVLFIFVLKSLLSTFTRTQKKISNEI